MTAKALFLHNSQEAQNWLLSQDQSQIIPISEANECEPYLTFVDGKLFVQAQNRGQFLSAFVDFLSPEFKHRKKYGMGKNQLFAKALGLKEHPQTALDLTAGFGTDSYIMSLWGLDVTGLERDPAVFLLLSDGLRRLCAEGPVDHLKFLQEEAVEFLNREKSQFFDVIYFDPMFSLKKKAALAPKEMQILHNLVDQPNVESDKKILELAIELANRRVVVKRPIHAPPILDQPAHRFEGKSVRYDMYLSRHNRQG